MAYRIRGTGRTRAALACLMVFTLMTSSIPLTTSAAARAARNGSAASTRQSSYLNVATVERQLMAVVSQVEGANLSSAARSSLLRQLARIATQLQTADSVNRQLGNDNGALALLLQSKVDALASIDKISSDLQINLDQLQANVDATVNANVDASLGGITVTVKAQAEQIKADLGAQADQLLVDIHADLNVIKVVTLHAQAHVDARRLAVTLHALVTKLTLDLSAVLKDLQVLAKADVKAALSAEARLRVAMTAQVNGVRTQVTGGLDSRIRLQTATINALTLHLDSILASASSNLTRIQGQV